MNCNSLIHMHVPNLLSPKKCVGRQCHVHVTLIFCSSFNSSIDHKQTQVKKTVEHRNLELTTCSLTPSSRVYEMNG